MPFQERQLTFDAAGHTLNNNQVFSPDGNWIVFDSRNDDSGLRQSGYISMVNVHSGQIKPLYHTEHQTEFGPGVGAATFSPVASRVVFLHGTRNADKDRPYDFTRRTAVAIDIDKPFQPIFLDARNITEPYTPGALRGGTHAHSWSGDGALISCTYNDYVLQQAAKSDSTIKDLRTVAVLSSGHPVEVPENGLENNDGEMFSSIVGRVTATPAAGSDEIDKAFDETWIGTRGYRQASGRWQQYAIACQGNVRDSSGHTKTEVFVIDLPNDLTTAKPGTPTTLPGIATGVTQRRVTFTTHGIEGPRFWLRTTPDGEMIGFLARDAPGHVQIFGVSPNGGAIRQLTNNTFSVQGCFNFSPDGKWVAYIGDNSIFITELATGTTLRLTTKTDHAPQNGVIWSNDGKTLAYNRYVDGEKGNFIQIFLLTR